MYNRYGIGAYNYGNDGQHINTTLLFFKDSLRTQHPKIALFETFFISSVLKDTNLGRETYYTRMLPESAQKKIFLIQCFGNSIEKWISYYLPLFGLHENWTSISRNSFKHNSSDVDFTKTMGYLNVGTKAEDGFDIIPGITPQLPLSDESVKILDEIVYTARDNGIQLAFYTAPFHGWYAYGDAIAEYAEQNEIPYINFFERIDETDFDPTTDFYDKNHINANGAIKVADYLGAFLKDNYDLTDFRTIPGNQWEMAQQ